MAPTGIIYDPIYLLHDTGQHVEISKRLRVIDNVLEKFGLKEKLEYIKPIKARVEDVELFHDPGYVKKVQQTAKAGGGQLDPDTVVSSKSHEVALLAAGGAITATELVMDKKLKNALALVRPPGHHAEKARAMGFCLFNNGVIAVKKAQKKYGLKKVLILDWDAHHGNGIQRAFYDDPSVLYISVHQDGIFPQTGWANEVGTEAGEGYTINIPVSSRTGDAGYYYLFTRLILPVIYQYKPELIVVNAGFDAHFNDNMSGLEITTPGFMRMTEMIKEAAEKLCAGRLVAFLEGGYDLETLGHSVAGMVTVMADLDNDINDPIKAPPNVIRPQSRIRLDDAIDIQKKYWNLEGPK